jgi:hypothetical protein
MLDLVVGFWQWSWVEGQPVVLQPTGFLAIYGLADGGLASPVFYDGGADGFSFAVTDLNGDGFADVVASNNGELSVYFGGSDSLSGPISLFGGVAPTTVGAGVFRDGGGLDLIEAGDAGALLFLNPGDGGFSGQNSESINLSDSLLNQIVVFDLNGDGLADLAVLNGYAVCVFINAGFPSFTFSCPIAPSTIPGPSPLLAQPLVAYRGSDGNGRIAIPRIQIAQTGCYGVACETWYLQVVAVDSSGSTLDGGLYAIIGLNDPNPLYPSFLTAGDFNGDGFVDIAAAGYTGYSDVQILFGDGHDGFEAPLVYTTDGGCAFTVASLGPVTGPHALAVADQCGAGITIIGDASKPGGP